MRTSIAHIDRIIRENGKEFGDEEHFIYVDSSKDDGSELGRLMHDFRVKEAKEMQAGALKDRVHELKETEKGVEHMCKEMEALRLEGVEEGRLEEKRECQKHGGRRHDGRQNRKNLESERPDGAGVACR